MNTIDSLGVVARKLRPIIGAGALSLAMIVCLARFCPRATQAAPRGEAAVAHLKERKVYASLAEAMAAARQSANQASQGLTLDGTSVQLAKLTAQDGATKDRLGQSVAIYADTIVVGAPDDDTSRGAAYVFARSRLGYSFQQKLTSNNSDINQHFGCSVAISGDTIVVGAKDADSRNGAAYVFTRSDGAWSLQQKLSSGDEEGFAVFGESVAIDGDTAVIGATELILGLRLGKGSAYVFERKGGVWSRRSRLITPDGASRDRFGASVAISGGTVVVGAPSDDVGGNEGQGSAHVFTRSGDSWALEMSLAAQDGAAADVFGNSVAVAGDWIVVGAPGDGFDVNDNPGSAYVFERSGKTWIHRQKLVAADGVVPNGFFGSKVALSGEGLVISRPGDDNDQGAVFIFARSPLQPLWVKRQKIIARDGVAGDLFGSSVAVHGGAVVVGAAGDDGNRGSAYVFDQLQELQANDGKLGDRFGAAVAADGDTVVVGAPGGKGAAYVFTQSEAGYSFQQKLSASDGEAGDEFGFAVAINGDTIVAGAPQDNGRRGAAYVYVRVGGNWVEQQKIAIVGGFSDERLGHSVALNGDTALIGAPFASADNGVAYMFTRTGATWSAQQKLIPNDRDEGEDAFGYSVAFDGDTAVIGAIGDDIGDNGNQGSAYIFTRSANGWEQQQKLVANDGRAGDRFGAAVAIRGATVVIGCDQKSSGQNPSRGLAYVFDRFGANWVQRQKLTASDGDYNDRFGVSVAIHDNTIVAGAPGHNSKRGAAYVFTRLGQIWTERVKLTDEESALTGQLFGSSVAISGAAIVAGAPDVFPVGKAFVLPLPPNAPAPNAPPTVSASAMTRAAGDRRGEFFFIKIFDIEDTPESLTLTINGGPSATVNGVTVGDFFPIESGHVRAAISAACDATNANFTLRVTDSGGASAETTLTVNVTPNPAPGFGYDPEHSVTLGGSLAVTVDELIDNGDSVSVELLGVTPAFNGSVNLDQQSGRVSITNASPAGKFAFKLRATDACGAFTDASFTLNVTSDCQTITVNPASLPAGTMGQAYKQAFTAVGGEGAHKFSVSAGALPSGLALSPDGSLSGAPSQAGAFNFTIRATDEKGCQGERVYAMTVNQGNCSYLISPSNHAFGMAGGSGAINVTAGEGCAWTAASDAPWITITSSGSGVGPGSVTFTVAKNPDGGARNGTLTIANQKSQIAQAAEVVCVSAASFDRNALATESIVAAFGVGLAQSVEAATTLPLPTTLAGAQVSVRDSQGVERLAPLFFVSPNQINFQMPPGAASGKAIVTVISQGEVVAVGSPQIEMVSPGLFSADASGQGLISGVALRVKADGSQSFEPLARYDEEKQRLVAEPIDLGVASDRVFLVLFATGARYRSSLTGVGVKIGGMNVDALYVGPQGSFAGLDQLNVELPRGLVGRGEVDVAVIVDGAAANVLKVSIK